MMERWLVATVATSMIFAGLQATVAAQDGRYVPVDVGEIDRDDDPPAVHPKGEAGASIEGGIESMPRMPWQDTFLWLAPRVFLRVPVVEGISGWAEWGGVAFGNGDDVGHTKSGNLLLGADYDIPLREWGELRVGAGVAVPLASLRSDASLPADVMPRFLLGYEIDGYSVAAAGRGLWDAPLWAWDTTTLMAQVSYRLRIGPVIVRPEAALGLMLVGGDTGGSDGIPALFEMPEPRRADAGGTVMFRLAVGADYAWESLRVGAALKEVWFSATGLSQLSFVPRIGLENDTGFVTASAAFNLDTPWGHDGIGITGLYFRTGSRWN